MPKGKNRGRGSGSKELPVAPDDYGWRAEDSYFFRETARVTAVPDEKHAQAISLTGLEVRLVGKRADVRSMRTYLSASANGAPIDAEQCVRFRVEGCSALVLRVLGGDLTSAHCIQVGAAHGLSPAGSEVAVALATHDGQLFEQVWCDGRPVTDPHSSPSRDYNTAVPELIKTVQGVQVVERYKAGAGSWEGVYVRCTLESRGAKLRMRRAGDASPPSPPGSGGGGGVPSTAGGAAPSANDEESLLSGVRRARWERCMFHAASSGDVAGVREAIEHGADPNAVHDEGMTALHWACFKERATPELAQYLVRHTHADLSMRDEEGYTALDLAVEDGRADLVQLLLEEPRPDGASRLDVDAPMSDGMTPLSRAIDDGKEAIVALLERAGAKARSVVRVAGPVFETHLVGEHQFGSGTPRCGFARVGRQSPSSYPPGFLGMLHRLSDQHYSMLALVLDGEPPTYQDATSAGAGGTCWRRHWLPTKHWWDHAGDPAIVDTVHMDLVDPADGSSLLRTADLEAACGEHVHALFLHAASAVGAADLARCLTRCPNLRCLCVSECVVDDSVLRTVATRCRQLRALRLYMCTGVATSASLHVALLASSTQLQWLDLGCPWQSGHGVSADSMAVAATQTGQVLRQCTALRVVTLPSAATSSAAIAGLASCSHLTLLHVEGRAQPLSTLEPLVAATSRCDALADISGFTLDRAASDGACALANRLVVPLEEAPFPREALAKCRALAELHVRCNIDEDDVLSLLALKDSLRALHLSTEGLAPEAISALSHLKQLRALSLAGCLRSSYAFGDGGLAANDEALISLRFGQLRQLDLSAHYDAFYACVYTETLVPLYCCSPKLQRYNLADNGRKFNWAELRQQLRRLAADGGCDEGDRVEVMCGDGITEVLQGGDEGQSGDGSQDGV